MLVDGSESDADLGALKELDAVMVLLKISPNLSRVHASRRVFEQLQQQQVGAEVGGPGAATLWACSGCAGAALCLKSCLRT